MKIVKKWMYGVMMFLMAAAMLVPTAQAQAAKKKKVQLVTKVDCDGDVYKYTYNKNGQLTKKKHDGYTTTYTYKNDRIVKSVEKPKKGSDSVTITYKYDKKGGLKEADLVSKSDGRTVKGSYKFTADKAGHVTSIKWVTRNKTKSHIAYTWKNGVLVTESDKKRHETTKYTYDANGFVASMSGDGFTGVYSYKMKNGVPTKRTGEFNEDGDTSSDTTKFSYKTAEIKKKYTKQVDEQQVGLINNVVPQYFLVQ